MEASSKNIVRRYLEEVINSGDVERVSEFIDARCIDHNDPEGTGVEGAKRHLCAVRSTFADLQVTIEEQIAEGDLVVTRVTGRATHKGGWLGITPTNKPVTIQAVNIDRISNGKTVAHWGVADTFQALFTIGALSVRSES